MNSVGKLKNDLWPIYKVNYIWLDRAIGTRMDFIMNYITILGDYI